MTPLEEVKQRTLVEVDHAAESARLKFSTTVYGQDQVYIEKTNQAVDYAAANFPEQIERYPFIKAEADALEIPPRDVAENILRTRSQWINFMAKVEGIRLRGKKLIRNATDITTVTKLRNNTIETLKQL